jgi:hypothetical protein
MIYKQEVAIHVSRAGPRAPADIRGMAGGAHSRLHRLSAGRTGSEPRSPTLCKTVGSAYPGTNPGPATTTRNGGRGRRWWCGRRRAPRRRRRGGAVNRDEHGGVQRGLLGSVGTARTYGAGPTGIVKPRAGLRARRRHTQVVRMRRRGTLAPRVAPRYRPIWPL